MNTLDALNTLITVTNTIAQLSSNAQQISAMIAKAQAEGRTEFTPAEWATITGADDTARAALVDAVTRALRGGK